VAVSILQRPLSPQLAAFAMAALSFAEFRPHASRAIAAVTAPDVLGALLREAWRCAQHPVARGMAAGKELACLDGRGKLLLQLPPHVLIDAPRWIAATGVPEEIKIVALRELARHTDAEVRHAAAWTLGTRPDERALTALRTLAGGDDAVLAERARLQIACRHPGEYTLIDLIRFAQGEATDPAAKPVSREPRDFDEFWRQFDDLPDEMRRRVGPQIAARSPRLKPLLMRLLQDADAGHRVRALRIVGLLELASELSEQLYPLAHDAEPEVRSAAVAALAGVTTQASKRILRNALHDQDARVAANAVEAVEAGGGPDSQSDLLPLLMSPDNRVRANAVKALLKLGVREAAETLLKMMNDKTRSHRISALWLVERMGLFMLAKRIVSMAAADEDQQVRVRAGLLADQLKGGLPVAAAADAKEGPSS
jgi:HEAT repeat protein